MDQYQEVNTNEEDVTDLKPSTKCIFKQVLICSSVWIQFIMAGLCVGAPTVIVPQINKEANATIIDSDLNSWIFATQTISSTPWVLIIPFFTERFGRKIPQIISTLDSVVMFICYYASSNAYHIIMVELLQGYMSVSNLTVAIMIITEYTSPRLRGPFLTVTGAAFFWGIWIADVIGTFFHWRNITIFGFICSFYTLTVFIWPESPYWLASKGRFDECRKAYRWLHGYSAETELRALIATKQEEMNREKTEVKISFWSYTKSPEFYKPMILAIVAVLQYQCSGKMICSLFILDIFKNITSSETTAYMAMLILNGVTVISMYSGSYLAKILKRRTLYMSSSFIGVAFLLTVSLYIYLCKRNVLSEDNYIVIALLTAYTISISCGPMILSMTIYGELFSTKFQSGSYTIISIVITVSYVVLIKVAPLLFEMLGLDGSFLMYGITCGLCTLYLFIYLPETKDKTQSEIEAFFVDKKKDNIMPTLVYP